GKFQINREDSISDDGSDVDITDYSESEKEKDEGFPDNEKFPLLHSIFYMNQGCNLFYRLINEILQFNASKVMACDKGNNTQETLLAVPQF
ncbi:MAG: hypothetical protein ACK53Y_05680, partial [bacterium]